MAASGLKPQRRVEKPTTAVLAAAMKRRGQGEPPGDDSLVEWLQQRPDRLAWACANRPREAVVLGLIERPLPRLITDLRSTAMPLDERTVKALKACLRIAPPTMEELTLGLADRPLALQTVLGLMTEDNEGR